MIGQNWDKIPETAPSTKKDGGISLSYFIQISSYLLHIFSYVFFIFLHISFIFPSTFSIFLQNLGPKGKEREGVRYSKSKLGIFPSPTEAYNWSELTYFMSFLSPTPLISYFATLTPSPKTPWSLWLVRIETEFLRRPLVLKKTAAYLLHIFSYFFFKTERESSDFFQVPEPIQRGRPQNFSLSESS